MFGNQNGYWKKVYPKMGEEKTALLSKPENTYHCVYIVSWRKYANNIPAHSHTPFLGIPNILCISLILEIIICF